MTHRLRSTSASGAAPTFSCNEKFKSRESRDPGGIFPGRFDPGTGIATQSLALTRSCIIYLRKLFVPELIVRKLNPSNNFLPERTIVPGSVIPRILHNDDLYRH